MPGKRIQETNCSLCPHNVVSICFSGTQKKMPVVFFWVLGIFIWILKTFSSFYMSCIYFFLFCYLCLCLYFLVCHAGLHCYCYQVNWTFPCSGLLSRAFLFLFIPALIALSSSTDLRTPPYVTLKVCVHWVCSWTSASFPAVGCLHAPLTHC